MQVQNRRTEPRLVARSILSADALWNFVARCNDVGASQACTFLGPTTNDHYLVETATDFDFDCCGPGWRVYDLATFQHNLGLDAATGATWRSCLRSYAERRPMSEADAEAVPFLDALCEFWLMGGRAARVADWGILGLDDRLDRGVRFLKRWESDYLENLTKRTSPTPSSG